MTDDSKKQLGPVTEDDLRALGYPEHAIDAVRNQLPISKLGRPIHPWSEIAIAPALTREEWERIAKQDDYPARPIADIFRVPMRTVSRSIPNPNDMLDLGHQAMALANYRPPEGDPRKFTHDDVQTLVEVIGYLESEGREHGDVDAIVAKLRAILPPRSVT